uniref:Uncharacterized protein n=1 Tax=Sipha flava TaxID=143950 RepID=A0A2S2Q2Z7_9HEMI
MTLYTVIVRVQKPNIAGAGRARVGVVLYVRAYAFFFFLIRSVCRFVFFRFSLQAAGVKSRIDLRSIRQIDRNDCTSNYYTHPDDDSDPQPPLPNRRRRRRHTWCICVPRDDLWQRPIPSDGGTYYGRCRSGRTTAVQQ